MTQEQTIERWFRTCKDQWMASLDIRDFHSLDELRGNLMAYVNKYNQTVHSSLKGKTPQDRFFSEPERIRLRYSPDMEDIFIVEQDGTLTPIRLLNKQENSFVKREKIHLCRGGE